MNYTLQGLLSSPGQSVMSYSWEKVSMREKESLVTIPWWGVVRSDSLLSVRYLLLCLLLVCYYVERRVWVILYWELEGECVHCERWHWDWLWSVLSWTLSLYHHAHNRQLQSNQQTKSHHSFSALSHNSHYPASDKSTTHILSDKPQTSSDEISADASVPIFWFLIASKTIICVDKSKVT